MEAAQPGRGEELHSGPPVRPRVAATVIVLRDGDRGLELLLVQRNPASRFMGGAWVFPGGAVDPTDGEGEEGVRWAALRELAEETGLRVEAPDQLLPFSRWITPPEVSIRFDTWFFLTPAPHGAEPRVDGGECVDWRWSTPADALAAHRAGELELVFPTIKHLEQLSGFATANELIAYAFGQEIRTVTPRVVSDGEMSRIVLPGEPGYDARRA
ncbi:MAG: hydrolase [Conexibacter sp.]|jgi:8-oxo-dGTP pyrophosphatase MutT (NUDIX family)|nr:hydrolase [Conexibacter sp.]